MKNLPKRRMEVQLEDGKMRFVTQESRWKCFPPLANQLRQPISFLVVIIKGDVSAVEKDFADVELHRKQPAQVLNEKSANGAPLASNQTALERDFSPFNDE